MSSYHRASSSRCRELLLRGEAGYGSACPLVWRGCLLGVPHHMISSSRLHGPDCDTMAGERPSGKSWISRPGRFIESCLAMVASGRAINDPQCE